MEVKLSKRNQEILEWFADKCYNGKPLDQALSIILEEKFYKHTGGIIGLNNPPDDPPDEDLEEDIYYEY
jgi:hypothetical protein